MEELISAYRKGEFSKIIHNSSLVEKNDLFFALKGEKVDGVCFLEDAAKRGAKAAVVPIEYEGDSYGLKLFYVRDVLKSLKKMAKKVLLERKTKVIAITGSVGKTIAKELIAQLIEKKYKIYKSPSSYNSQVTLPVNVLNANGDEEFLVLEMGMSMPGELKKLINIAPPFLSIITKIAHSHVEYFPKGIDEIAQVKTQIFLHPKTKYKVFNYQLLDFSSVSSRLVGTSFSLEDERADYSIFSKGNGYFVKEDSKIFPLPSLPFYEKHLLENLSAAICVARILEISFDEIFSILPNLRLPKWRFEKIYKNNVLYIADCYNANKESMLAAITSIPKTNDGGRKIAVLGSMKELGIFSEQCHKIVGEKALNLMDKVFFFGIEWKVMGLDENEIFLDKLQMFKKIKRFIKENDVVLVKGSRSLALEEFFNYI